MKEVSTIGLDLAKTVFQVHGVDGSGETVIRRQLRRGQVLPFFKKLPPCLVGMEACATSHHWAREITALGHEVRMMPARYVKPYVKRNKNDMADAEAICEAVTRPLPHDEHNPEDIDTNAEDHAADALRYGCMSHPYVRDKPLTDEDRHKRYLERRRKRRYSLPARNVRSWMSA